MKNQPFRTHLKLLCLLLCVAGGTMGCGDDPAPPTPKVKAKKATQRTQQVSFWSAPNLNFGTPVPIDFVTVYSPELGDFLRGLTAEQYFDRRGQIARDFPDDLYIHPLEIVGGVFAPDIKLTYPTNGFGATFVFALYRTPGDHRARMPDLPAVMVNLNEDDFEFRPLH